MIAQEWLLPVVFVASAAPMFVIAGMVARGNLQLINGLDPTRLRDPDSLARRLSRLLAAVGFAIVSGGAGMLWAGGDHSRIIAVVVALVMAVNGLAIALIVAVAKAKRDYRPPQK